MAVLFGFLMVLSLVSAAALGLLAWLNARRVSLLGGPRVHVADLRPGNRKVRGRLISHEPLLLSPVTNRPCVYYRLRVDQERSQEVPRLSGSLVGRLREPENYTRVVKYWQNILDATCSSPFLVDDGTGEVAVQPDEAEVIVKQRSRISTDITHGAPAHLQDLLRQRYGIWTVDRAGRVKTLVFQEEIIEEGTQVTVVGPVEVLRDGTLCFEAGPGPLVVSERGLERQADESRRWAIGLAVGAGVSFILAFISLVVVAAIAR
jgi:hypothetical protein